MKNSKQQEGVIESFFEELVVAEKHPRSLVIIANGYIELFINTLIDEKCKNGKNNTTKNNRDYPLSVKLTLLNELNVLDKRLFQILDNFRKIRNRAAHDPSFSITTADWGILNKGLDRFILGESKRKPNNLAHFSKLLIGTLWNEHLDTMTKIKL